MAVVLSVVVPLWAYTQLPDQVATHFGGSGDPDGWMSRGANLGFSLAMSLLLVGLMPVIAWATTLGDLTFVNFPTKAQKEYWTRPENRAAFRAKFVESMAAFGAMLALFLVAMEIEMVAANHREPPHMGVSMWVALGVFLAGTGWWIVDLFRILRIPPGAAQATQEPTGPDRPGHRIRG